MDFSDEQYLELEKERLLAKYACNTIEEVLIKQKQIIREQIKKK